MLRLMKFNELFVFVVISSMCSTHDKSREILTPQIFSRVCFFQAYTVAHIHVVENGSFFLFVTLITSHLSDLLSDINHSHSQFSEVVLENLAVCLLWNC